MSVRGHNRPGPERCVDWDHRGAAGMDGFDDLGVVDALQVIEVMPRLLWPSWRWMTISRTPSRASSTACACRSWCGAKRRRTPAAAAVRRSSARAAALAQCRPRVGPLMTQNSGPTALGAQADLLRVPLADGTLIATPDVPADDLIPSLLSASDVLGTGWFGAVAAEAGPGKTVAVVGDGAVGLLAVLAAKQLGAERIIAMSRHTDRQRLAREYGATDIVEARGDEGVAAIKELTNGLGAHSVVEAVGTQESMNLAIHATRPGGHVGFVGVAHGVSLDGTELFWSLARVHGGPAPVRRFLPELIDLIWNRQINPGKVFDLELSLDQAADAYRAMDQREAIKVLLRP
jgi:threonine dehydrogenase-like Zn-dependent dehydrogenase